MNDVKKMIQISGESIPDYANYFTISKGQGSHKLTIEFHHNIEDSPTGQELFSLIEEPTVVDNNQIRFMLNSANAKCPTRGTHGAAGFDLYASSGGWVWANSYATFNTGVSMAIPPHLDGQICPRSGLAFKKGIVAVNGEIDPDYRGAVSVMLVNHTDKDFHVAIGDRIAQIVFRHVSTNAALVDSLDETARGTNGFGSTGY